MAGKGIISKTDCNTYIFRLIMDGVVIDRIEVDELFGKACSFLENDIAEKEESIAKQIWEGTYGE